jgi:drug/metabolite transporter (DMT)-like permease
MGIGELSSLGCAVSWSIAIIFFKKFSALIHPIHINLSKNFLALLMMIPTAWLIDGQVMYQTDPHDLMILVLSGAFGIGVADSLMLITLKLVGATRFAIIDCFYTPIMVAVSFLLFGETVNAQQVLGGSIILTAVMLISLPNRHVESIPFSRNMMGIGVGIAALIIIAFGIISVKPIFPKYPLFWIVITRLTAGTISSAAISLCMSDRKQAFKTLFTGANFYWMLLAAFFSTYISMIMWLNGFKHASTSVAAVLNQTSTIFTVLMAAFVLGETLTKRSLVGTILAFIGVVVVSLS